MGPLVRRHPDQWNSQVLFYFLKFYDNFWLKDATELLKHGIQGKDLVGKATNDSVFKSLNYSKSTCLFRKIQRMVNQTNSAPEMCLPDETLIYIEQVAAQLVLMLGENSDNISVGSFRSDPSSHNSCSGYDIDTSSVCEYAGGNIEEMSGNVCRRYSGPYP